MLVKVTQKPGSEGLCGAPPTLPRGDEGRPGGRLYSQVGDARRLHLREGGRVGAEGGRALNPPGRRGRAPGRASAVVSHEPDTPGHPGTRGPRPSPTHPRARPGPAPAAGRLGLPRINGPQRAQKHVSGQLVPTVGRGRSSGSCLALLGAAGPHGPPGHTLDLALPARACLRSRALKAVALLLLLEAWGFCLPGLFPVRCLLQEAFLASSGCSWSSHFSIQHCIITVPLNCPMR